MIEPTAIATLEVVKILFGWELGFGMGHLAPHRSLFEALIARGDRLHLVVRDPQRAQAAFAGLPVQVEKLPFQVTPPARAIAPTFTLAEVLHNSGFHESSSVATMVSGWRRVIDAIAPDLVLVDAAPALLLALRSRDTRVVSLATGFFSPPPGRPLPVFWTLAQWMQAGTMTTEDALLLRLNQALDEHAAAPLSRVADLFHEGVETILLTYRELDHYPERPDDSYHGTAPAPARGVAPPWPDAQGPRIYGYLKPTVGLPRALAEIAQLGCPTLVVGDGIPREVQTRLTTKTLRFTSEHVDLHRVAESCDLALHNGNHATAIHFLRSGIPCLSLPIFLEQEIVTGSLLQCGAGLALSSRSGQGAFRLVHRLLTEGTFRNAARRFAAAHPHPTVDGFTNGVLKRLNAPASV